jgi:nucleoid DNA-binding protein
MAKAAKKKAAGGKALTKSETYRLLAESCGVSRKQVAAVFDELRGLIGKELTKNKKGGEVFTVPGLLKIRRIFKEAQPERQGIDPFTKQPKTFKAKPAHYVIRVRALKGLKDLVNK